MFFFACQVSIPDLGEVAEGYSTVKDIFQFSEYQINVYMEK